MSSTVKTILKYTLTLAIGIFLLWLLINQQTENDKKEIKRAFFIADYFWIGLTIIISLIEKVFRAHRWNLLIEPVAPRPSLKNTFNALMVGYMANIFLPRMGEVARCGLLKKTDNIPVNTSFGTVVSERVIDFICLLILIGIGLTIEFSKISDLLILTVWGKIISLKNFLWQHQWLLVMIGLILSAVSLYLYAKREKIRQLSVFKKIKEFTSGVVKSILSVRSLRRKKEFLLFTFLIWTCYYFMTYLAFFSLQSTTGLPWSAGIIILIVGGLGMSAPVQAGIAAFHFFVQKGLIEVYGADPGGALSYAFLVHTSQTVLAFLAGLICLIFALNISKKTKQAITNVNA